MPSYFDQMSHTIKCPAPECGKTFEQTYRSLVETDKVVCPACGTTIDIRESKRTGEIGLWFNTLAELGKKVDHKK